MKKLLLVLAIGAFVASCNDSGTTEEPTGADSTLNAAPDSSMITPDTTGTVDSSAIAPDTTTL